MKRIFFLIGILTLNLFSATKVLAEEELLLNVATSEGKFEVVDKSLPKSFRMNQIKFRIFNSNPDNLVAQIVLLEKNNNIDTSELFDKWNLNLWIWGPNLECIDTNNCDYILRIIPNINMDSDSKQNTIRLLKRQTAQEFTVLDCPSKWREGTTSTGNAMISLSLSLSCLNIQSSFAFYAYSGYDIGAEEEAKQYTLSYLISNDYFNLAKQAYENNGGRKGLDTPDWTSESNRQLCVTATTGAGYAKKVSINEQCTDDTKTWQYTYCGVHPKSDLEVMTSKKWKKVKTYLGIKSKNCIDSSTPYEYNFSRQLELEKVRIKNYGTSKFKTGYLNVGIDIKYIATLR